nr:hypothetical protein [Tanacetum cinerariifolium]
MKLPKNCGGGILKTFGRNEATKKTKKNQLKQQCGNFKAEGLETLEQTSNRLQAIVSHLEFMNVEIKQDDLNQNFLTSLAPEWLMYHCLEKQAPRSQDRGKRESYKQGPKEEEPAPKALMAIDGIGWDWSYMANEEENHALVANDEVPTEFALMAKSSLSSENDVYDDSYCSKSCRKNTENLNTKISKLNEELSDCETYPHNYKKGLERDVEVRNNKIEYLMNELEKVKNEKEGLDNKLTRFESASKDLDNLLGSQRSDKNLEGLEYNGVPPFLHKSIHLLRKICLGQVKVTTARAMLMLPG